MTISYTKNFLKQSKKLNPTQRKKLLATITLFNKNPLHPTLRNHALKGKYEAYRSIDISGDMRALYFQNENEVIFDALGTHSQLYG